MVAGDFEGSVRRVVGVFSEGGVTGDASNDLTGNKYEYNFDNVVFWSHTDHLILDKINYAVLCCIGITSQTI